MTEKKKQGFASMTPERRREISASGGRAAHAKGTAHRFTSEEASIQGRKGGRPSWKKHLQSSPDPDVDH